MVHMHWTQTVKNLDESLTSSLYSVESVMLLALSITFYIFLAIYGFQLTYSSLGDRGDIFIQFIIIMKSGVPIFPSVS